MKPRIRFHINSGVYSCTGLVKQNKMLSFFAGKKIIRIIGFGKSPVEAYQNFLIKKLSP